LLGLCTGLRVRPLGYSYGPGRLVILKLRVQVGRTAGIRLCAALVRINTRYAAYKPFLSRICLRRRARRTARCSVACLLAFLGRVAH
jgi:hypothetical protein